MCADGPKGRQRSTAHARLSVPSYVTVHLAPVSKLLYEIGRKTIKGVTEVKTHKPTHLLYLYTVPTVRPFGLFLPLCLPLSR